MLPIFINFGRRVRRGIAKPMEEATSPKESAGNRKHGNPPAGSDSADLGANIFLIFFVNC